MTDLLPHSVRPSLMPSFHRHRHPRPFLPPSTFASVRPFAAGIRSLPPPPIATANTANGHYVEQWLADTTEGSPRALGPPSPPLPMNGSGPPRSAPPDGGPYGPGTDHGGSRIGATPYYPSLAYLGHQQSVTTVQPRPAATSQGSSPTRKEKEGDRYDGTSRRTSAAVNQIVSYLQIPATINDSQGSLAEFATQITCLLWFESSLTLHRVEGLETIPLPTSPLVLEAIPTMGFRKWVTTILSTTQVTQNVILLALLFIYRLKKLNPTVKGKSGSEFRLLTVALMLGNKFLDDNTYTNKTWAEVSGISVQEIHVMEVEFLSNMKYTLYASDVEWKAWHRKLSRFWDYFDQASKPSAETRPRGPPTPHVHAPLALPSPPPSLHASPPYLGPQSTETSARHPPHPLAMYPYGALPMSSPVGRMPELDLRPGMRKRSHDEPLDGPAVKRLARAVPTASLPSMPTPATSTFSAPRLPTPNLSISTNGPYGMFGGSHLPHPAGRSMMTVYPPGRHWSQSGELLTPTSQAAAAAAAAAAGPLTTLPSIDEQFRRFHPMNSRNPSPTTTSFAHSQDSVSPSGYPYQRNSPYRPLRAVNTLLVSPPPTSLQTPSQHIGYHEMHYQPLGKPLSERKTGVVPHERFESWSQMPQWGTLPLPYLPQPTSQY